MSVESGSEPPIRLVTAMLPRASRSCSTTRPNSLSLSEITRGPSSRTILGISSSFEALLSSSCLSSSSCSIPIWMSSVIQNRLPICTSMLVKKSTSTSPVIVNLMLSSSSDEWPKPRRRCLSSLSSSGPTIATLPSNFTSVRNSTAYTPPIGPSSFDPDSGGI